MAEIRTVTTLRNKRDQIAAAIASYEQKLAQARADLAHINASITIFEASGERQVLPPYVDVHRIFARGEAIELCKMALASGPMTTRQLAIYVMGAKGLDVGDKVLAKAIAGRLIHSLRQQCRRGRLIGETKIRGVRVWQLPSSGNVTLPVTAEIDGRAALQSDSGEPVDLFPIR